MNLNLSFVVFLRGIINTLNLILSFDVFLRGLINKGLCSLFSMDTYLSPTDSFLRYYN
jgi:hypothetical protein